MMATSFGKVCAVLLHTPLHVRTLLTGVGNRTQQGTRVWFNRDGLWLPATADNATPLQASFKGDDGQVSGFWDMSLCARGCGAAVSACFPVVTVL